MFGKNFESSFERSIKARSGSNAGLHGNTLVPPAGLKPVVCWPRWGGSLSGLSVRPALLWPGAVRWCTRRKAEAADQSKAA